MLETSPLFYRRLKDTFRLTLSLNPTTFESREILSIDTQHPVLLVLALNYSGPGLEGLHGRSGTLVPLLLQDLFLVTSSYRVDSVSGLSHIWLLWLSN